jgi:hypothetical protein
MCHLTGEVDGIAVLDGLNVPVAFLPRDPVAFDPLGVVHDTLQSSK